MEGKVFVALGNGDLVVYCRDIGKFLFSVPRGSFIIRQIYYLLSK